MVTEALRTDQGEWSEEIARHFGVSTVLAGLGIRLVRQLLNKSALGRNVADVLVELQASVVR